MRFSADRASRGLNELKAVEAKECHLRTLAFYPGRLDFEDPLVLWATKLHFVCLCSLIVFS